MRRNTWVRALNAAAKQARQAAMTPAEQTAANTASTQAVQAGGIDSTTGDWIGYGLVDVTPVGSFKVGAG